jgi:hypothetical protein
VRLGNHVSLFTVGAVLAFAVHLDLEVVDVATVGWILMLAAVTGAFVQLVVGRPGARAVPARTDQVPVPVRPVARDSQAPWPSWETRAFTPTQRPHQES